MLDIRNGSLILLNDSFEWEGKFTKERTIRYSLTI